MKKYPVNVFGALYFSRWGIETEYGMQKNSIQPELLSGYKVNTVLQDFHVSIFVSNLQNILSIPAQIKLAKEYSGRKYAYRIKKNVAIGILKRFLINIFIRKKTEILIRKIQTLFANHTEPVRPERSYLRVVKTKRSKGKHQTWTNYKRAI